MISEFREMMDDIGWGKRFFEIFAHFEDEKETERKGFPMITLPWKE